MAISMQKQSLWILSFSHCLVSFGMPVFAERDDLELRG